MYSLKNGVLVMANTYGYQMSYNQLIIKRNQDYSEQQISIEAYCDQHGLTIHSFYRDTSSHVIPFSRPNLNALLTCIQKDDSVIISSISVLSTSSAHIPFLARCFARIGANLVVTNDPAFTLYPTHNDELSKQVGLIQQYESFVTAINFARGKERKIRAGQKAGGAAPLGYRWNDEGHIELDQNTANLVQDIYNLYLSLGSIGKLKEYLDAQGILTPREKHFSKEALHLILTNDFYIGYVEQGRQREKGSHDIFLSDEIFSIVQRKMMINRRNQNN